MNEQTTIGIIIPSYNGERYIEECVTSVINQPCKDFIIVIIDDGSTDSTLNIANGLKERYDCISVIHQKNAGTSAARNRGIEFCLEKNVEYIAFLDSDDVWCTNFYTDELRDKIIDCNKDAYMFNTYLGNPNLTMARAYKPVTGKGKHGANQFFWQLFYRAEILKNDIVRFPVGIKMNEDCAFAHIFLMFCGSFEYCDKNLLVYRIAYPSSSRRKWDMYDLYFNNMITAWRYARNAAIELGDEEAARQCVATEKIRVVEYISEACRKGDSLRKIKRHLRESSYASPCDSDNSWAKTNWDKFLQHPRKFWIRKRLGKIKRTVLRNERYKSEQLRMWPIDLAAEGIYTRRERK